MRPSRRQAVSASLSSTTSISWNGVTGQGQEFYTEQVPNNQDLESGCLDLGNQTDRVATRDFSKLLDDSIQNTRHVEALTNIKYVPKVDQ